MHDKGTHFLSVLKNMSLVLSVDHLSLVNVLF